MSRSRCTRCIYCPTATRSSRTTASLHMSSLFPDAAPPWSPVEPPLPRQERALREALAPYLCLAELRHLAAHGDDLHQALTNSDDIPEEIQALLTLLQALLQPRTDERIEKPADVAALLMLTLGHLDHEEFWIVCLDAKNHVQRLHKLYQGSVNSTVVRVAELFRWPLLLKSAFVIVCHNHPSGDPTPSTEDLEVTRLIIQAGEVLQIEVLDHVIVGQGRWLSLHEQHLGGW
jgi:DNA repair protein RadC